MIFGKKEKINKIISTSFFVLFSYFVALTARANEGIVPVDGKQDGNYELSDLVLVGVNVSNWILKITGSLALLAFVVGGFMFIFSAGNREMVEKGKSTLTAATIGLVVVLLAYTVINFIMVKLGYNQSGFNGPWNQVK